MQTASLSNIIRISRAMLGLFLLIALTNASAPMAAAKAVLDFDGDGRTDYVVIRTPADIFSTPPMEWYVLLGSGGFMAQQFGNFSGTATGDRAMPEDYDGDGKCDFAVFRNNSIPPTLYYLSSETGTVQARELEGFSHPHMTQDFDGDGKADPAQATGENGKLIWKIAESRTGNLRSVHFGSYQDISLRGDYDGDGKADIAVYRDARGTPANTFFILRSSDGLMQSMVFGNSQTDIIVSADFDGDSKTDFAVWRGRSPNTDGVWYWIESSTGAFRSLHYGIGGQDFPVPGDYDGDGKTDQAVSRYEPAPEFPAGRLVFYVNQSTGSMKATHWGNGWDGSLGFYFAR